MSSEKKVEEKDVAAPHGFIKVHERHNDNKVIYVNVSRITRIQEDISSSTQKPYTILNLDNYSCQVIESLADVLNAIDQVM